MGISNRDKDASEKQNSVHASWELFVTAETKTASLVAHPSKMKSAHLAAKGLSSTPSYALNVRRWTADGVTLIPLYPATSVAVAFGTSGSTVDMSASIAVLSLESKDLIEIVSSVANSAADDVQLAIVLEALQDIKEEFGSQS